MWQSGLCNAAPSSAGLTKGDARAQRPGASVSTAYAARAKAVFLLAFVKRCAVSLAALGSQSRSPSAPSRPDAPTKSVFGCPVILPTRPATGNARGLAVVGGIVDGHVAPDLTTRVRPVRRTGTMQPMPTVLLVATTRIAPPQSPSSRWAG